MPKSQSNNGKPRAPDPFMVLYPFMWRDLDLRGIELLVFARAYGFCKRGGSFYESRARTADYLGISERSVTRAMGALVERDVLIDLDPFASLDGVSTRTYVISDWVAEIANSSKLDNLSPPDNLSVKDDETGEGLSSKGVPSWHLKSKRESKLE